jgi:riboflavin biosynthesis pyrimidine reductase
MGRRTPDDVLECAARIRSLYGRSADGLAAPPGVLHVTAVWRDEAGRAFTLRIGPRRPRSETDRFVLDLARARCDAVLTTGRILREEPDLHQVLPADLRTWRRHHRAEADDPVSVVLTGRDDLDFGHPLLARASHAIVLTSAGTADRLRARASSSGAAGRVEIVARREPGALDAIAFLQERRFSICVEAGPSTTAGLYGASSAVDELMLSVFQGELPDESVRGAESVATEVLERDFVLAGESRREDESGPWSFQRFVRASPRS